MNINKELILECSAKEFKEAFNHVKKVKSQDERRYGISGVMFSFNEKGDLVLTATDGNRLAQRSLRVKSTIKNFNEIEEKDYLLLLTKNWRRECEATALTRIFTGIKRESLLKVYLEKDEKGLIYTFETEVAVKKGAFNTEETKINSLSLRNSGERYPDIQNILLNKEELCFDISFRVKETIQFLKELKGYVGGWNCMKDTKRITFYRVDQKYFLTCEILDEKTGWEWIEKEVDFIEFSNIREDQLLAINALYLLDAISDKKDIVKFESTSCGDHILTRYLANGLDVVMPMNSKDVRLPSWEKKKEFLPNMPASTAKESPKTILRKSSTKGQEKPKSKKEVLKRKLKIQFKTLPRLYKKIVFQLDHKSCAGACINRKGA